MKNKTKNESGLPDIAQDLRAKKPIIISLTIVMICIVFTMYFFSKRHNEIKPQIEESYTVQSDIEVKKPSLATEEKIVPVAQAAPSVNQEIVQQQMELLQEKQKELQQRLSAPLMLVNSNQSNTTATIGQSNQEVSKDPNTQFLNQLSGQNSEVINAINMGSLSYVVAEGNFIHAILEPATNSDLPGSLRAIVSESVYSEDGKRVLVAPGSRLLGQYKSGMLQGQSRIFVVWTRLITTDGISVQLGSSGVDGLGVAGMGADEINRHFWGRLGTASLLSLIGAGSANVGANTDSQGNLTSFYRAAIASSFSQSAEQSLQQDSMIAPTLKTYQGKPINVFIAHDLNFEKAMKQTKPSKNVF